MPTTTDEKGAKHPTGRFTFPPGVRDDEGMWDKIYLEPGGDAVLASDEVKDGWVRVTPPEVADVLNRWANSILPGTHPVTLDSEMINTLTKGAPTRRQAQLVGVICNG